MQVVHKYQLIAGCLTRMPRRAVLLSVAEQDGMNWVWALIDPDEALSSRRLDCVYTGSTLSEPCGIFVGTIQSRSGLVYHIFDRGYQ